MHVEDRFATSWGRSVTIICLGQQTLGTPGIEKGEERERDIERGRERKREKEIERKRDRERERDR